MIISETTGVFISIKTVLLFYFQKQNRWYRLQQKQILQVCIKIFSGRISQICEYNYRLVSKEVGETVQVIYIFHETAVYYHSRDARRIGMLQGVYLSIKHCVKLLSFGQSKTNGGCKPHLLAMTYIGLSVDRNDSCLLMYQIVPNKVYHWCRKFVWVSSSGCNLLEEQLKTSLKIKSTEKIRREETYSVIVTQ